MKYNSIIEIQSKEWFDRINGNSHFSAKVYKDDELVAVLPFQYGYGSHSEDMANDALADNGIINNPRRGHNNLREGIHAFCRENKIKLIINKQEKCLKREVVSFGK